MSGYFDRYVRGDYEQVWGELLALGDQIRAEPLQSDALGVARETMMRARQNIELLVARLTHIGYRFGYAWVEEDEDYEDQRDLGENAPPTFAPPRSDAQERIAELERIAGPLPLSIRAWYETVGAVNFMGDLAGGWSEGECRLEHGLDPLEVAPIEEALEDAYRQQQKKSGIVIAIAPDYNQKFGISGDTYVIELPAGAADVPLKGEWHDTTFVNYLRICFKNGGFPGLERCIKRPKVIENLTQGLLPI